jgi:mutator protein MutT
MNSLIVNVSVVIFNSNNKILLCHRSISEDVFPGLWGIPGGKIDNEDVTLESGLKREVFEEVGIQIKNIRLISNNIREKSNGQYVVFMVYRADLAKGKLQALEDTDEVSWFKFEDIKPSNLTPHTYEVIKKAFNEPPSKLK